MSKREMTHEELKVAYRKLVNRIQESEVYKESYEGVVRALDNTAETLIECEEGNKRYREALEFYADPKVYFPQGDDYCSYITMDYGGKARLALEEQ